MYNTNNYSEQGGDRMIIDGELVINGKLTIAPDAEVEGLPDTGEELSGQSIGMRAAENQSYSTATTVSALRDEFNTLLSNLKEAGLMEADGDPDA